jgi:hypothetical protein
MTIIEPYSHADTLKRIRAIQWSTIFWMFVELVVSGISAWRAHSPALVAFGGDSGIELLRPVRAHGLDCASGIDPQRHMEDPLGRPRSSVGLDSLDCSVRVGDRKRQTLLLFLGTASRTVLHAVADLT